ncbi:MAG: TIGR01212 family radical SAM protein [Deltaproteobacteria bacterium]|nr:TIGR01212 family radical SAM protein [Deltaproteobacteria bacterium]
MDFNHWGGKRYNPLNHHLKQHFGCKVYRVSIDAGFTCPNRDGTVATGGCIYCCERGAASIGAERALTIRGQVRAGMEVMKKKNRAEKFIAYFQSFTNTYGDLSLLKKMYDEALSVEGVAGLAVSTRPDTLPEEIVDLLAGYHNKTYLWVELGLQSIHDKSLETINRGHDYAAFFDAYSRLRKMDLNICLHAILGLPGESKSDMIETAQGIGELEAGGIKLHLMHALKGTELAGMYGRGEWSPMAMDEYISLVCDVLERISPHTIIHRLTGDPLRGYLLAPEWSIKKWEVLNGIDRELLRRESFQGKRYGG